MKNIIGRKAELDKFKRFTTSEKSEFVALFGRRRVGKTFLIREYFANNFTFQLTGIANATTEEQLLNFDLQLQQFQKGELIKTKNWIEAFHKLSKYLETVKIKEKKVIFLDELPWLDTKNSDFIKGLEHFWNSWADRQSNVILIVCGSAASWMINNLIQSRGGLHNRLTERIKIYPFNLKETKDFLVSKGCQLTAQQIVNLYMTTGGIPYYLEHVPKGKSTTQIIQYLFFDTNSPLKDEFKQLYRALFKKHEIYEKIVEVLASKNYGMTRSELIEKGKFKSGGTITKVLIELEESGFINSYTPYDKKQKNTNYRLSDFYTSFYFRFLKDFKYREENYWINLENQPIQNNWKGLAFEQVCLSHISEIKTALGISGMFSHQSSWFGEAFEEKAQIDFLLERQDQVINLFECKFWADKFVIDKDYAAQLRRKIAVFKNATQTKKSVFLTMISTYGTQMNEHSLELVQNDITIDAFFN